MPESFLTVNEVAELLKLNEQTVRNWIDAGKLGAVRLGERRVRIRQSELDRFLTRGETSTAEADDRELVPDGGDDGSGEAISIDPHDQFVGALVEILRRATTGDPARMASTLREVAAAAEALADTLEHTG